MKLHTLSGVFVLGLVFTGVSCVLPDLHDVPGDTSSEGGTAGSGGAGAGTGSSSGGTPGTGGSPATGGSSGSGQSCSASGAVALRFANVAPAPESVDFCLGSNGKRSGPVAKIAASPGGIAFKSFMYYDYLVSGTLDIRVIPAGGSCSGESLGDIKDYCPSTAADSTGLSIYYVAGQAAGAPPLVILQDSAVDASALKLRFFNSIQGADGADFGLTDGGALPTTLSTAVASNIPFAEVPPAGNTILNVPVNEAGYLEITALPSDLTWQGWGVALAGDSSASAVVPFSTVSSNMGKVLTVVAAGRVGDPKYPIQFIGFPAPPPDGGAPQGPQQSPDVDTVVN